LAWTWRSEDRGGREKSPESSLNFDPEKTYSLPELIDLAESHNPETRVAWERTHAQATAWGVARSELYPTVAAAALAGADRDQAYLADFDVVLNLKYTIFAFSGARNAWSALTRDRNRNHRQQSDSKCSFLCTVKSKV
jgi:outer membrane protein TolC